MAKFEPKVIFIINSIVALFFGISFLFIPEIAGGMMGIDMTETATIGFARFMGCLILFVLGPLVFTNRNAPHSTNRQIVFIVLILGSVTMIILHILYHDLTNFMVISTIVIDAIFSLFYLYFFIVNLKKK